jgi:hypothetical protein
MPKLGLGSLLSNTRKVGGPTVNVGIVNQNFSNLTGLVPTGTGQYSGVPFGWVSQTTPNNLSVLESGGLFYANVNALSAVGEVYEDDFSPYPGALNGRPTYTNFGNWTTSDSAFQVGNGRITINSNTPDDYHAATFSIPALLSTDILSLSITVRPSGGDYIGIGFTPNSGEYLTHTGCCWILYKGLGSNTPGIQIFTGPSNTGEIYSAPLTNPALNFNASLPTTFQYTYSKSAKTLSISAVNGSNSATLLNNFDVSSVPDSAFQNFALQFQGQTLGSDTNPAYVDGLSISTNQFKIFYQDLGTLSSSAIASLRFKVAPIIPTFSNSLGFAFYNSTSNALISSGRAIIEANSFSLSSPKTILFTTTAPAGIPIRFGLWASTVVTITDISITLS